MRRWFTMRAAMRALSFTPIIAAYTLVQITEPFPHGWLSHDNPHYWPNVLRALTFSFAGVVLGMICYTLNKAITAERTVSGGHPRRKLYRHVTLISMAHGFLIATLLFYIRDRINFGLSPATPIATFGLIGTFVALAYMLSYQNSRLRSIHAAKTVLGVIERAEHDDLDLCVRVVGAAEPISLREWLEEFEGGMLARLSIEKVEEAPDLKAQRKFIRWLGRRDEEAHV